MPASQYKIELNFCRRCGTALTHKKGVMYQCQNGHSIFWSAPTGMALVLLNDQDEVLVLKRGIEPGKGLLDIPGGFCDGDETLEETIAREVAEEAGLKPADYTKPQYVLSAVESYDYEGETVAVLDAVFQARLTSGAQPIAGDDAAHVEFVPLKTLDMSTIYFAGVRKGLETVRAQL